MTIDQLKSLVNQQAELTAIEGQEKNLADSNKTFDALVKLAPSILTSEEKDDLAQYIEDVLRTKIATRKQALADSIEPILNVS